MDVGEQHTKTQNQGGGEKKYPPYFLIPKDQGEQEGDTGVAGKEKVAVGVIEPII